MAERPLHLVRVPLRVEKLMAIARRRGIALRDLDDGYLVHCVLRELWQEHAPVPFVLRGRGRVIDAWGYSTADAAALTEHARAFGDPALVEAIAGPGEIASKEMPNLPAGRRVGFLLRACPIVRLAKAHGGHRAGAEVDAFLARCFQVGSEEAVSRDEVYRAWLKTRLENPEKSGVRVERIALAGFARERLVRRTQGESRQARRLERADARFEGELTVVDGGRFLDLLAHGVGRHRGFGFGALLVVAPGTPYPME